MKTYEIDAARSKLMKYGTAITALEYSKLKDIKLTIMGVGIEKMGDLRISSIGLCVFAYLFACWVFALVNELDSDSQGRVSHKDQSQIFAEILKRKASWGVYAWSLLFFEAGVPIILAIAYLWALLFVGAPPVARVPSWYDGHRVFLGL